MRAIVIEPGRLPEASEIDGSLESLRAVIRGPLEALRVGEDAVAFIDEEAKVSEDAPQFNGVATAVCRGSLVGIHSTDFILGPMLIAGRLNSAGVDDGDVHDVPSSIERAVDAIAKQYAAAPVASEQEHDT